MEYEIVELGYSGKASMIYSIIPRGDSQTLFDNFVNEYKNDFREEIKDIINRLNHIGHEFGARISYFKENEGKYGDHVCALYDIPGKNLRLYCIRFGSVAVILGGGGVKDKNVRAWQDDEKLSQEVKLMMECSADISKRISAKEIYWSKDKKSLEGNLKNYEDE